MILGSFTHTDHNAAEAPAPGYNRNNNYTFDEASLFYAGRITNNIGAFAQLTYDNISGRLGMDNTDIRFARDTHLGGVGLTYGISLNNRATTQDLWNTTPTWGFPYSTSPFVAGPNASPFLTEALAAKVGGTTAYAMINNLLYLEAGAYANFSERLQKVMGSWGASGDHGDQLDGAAPYWRAALQHQFGGHYLAAGTFGMRADIFPGRDKSAGNNRLTDVGVDFTYQFLGNMDHITEFKGAYIRESQTLDASRLTGAALNRTNQLNSLNFNAAYTYKQTYGINAGYFRTSGSRDVLLYSGDNGFSNFRPNSEGYIAELVYVPFGKQDSLLAPWLNIRMALQYTAFTQLNGTQANAHQNNTLVLNGWLAF
jgi:hypothetical protein